MKKAEWVVCFAMVLMGCVLVQTVTETPMPTIQPILVPGCEEMISDGICMVSEDGDFVGGGQERLFAGPLTTQWSGELLAGSAGPWTFEFAAPAGDRLRERWYEFARRYPFNDANAGMAVFGQGRGCNALTGRFQIVALGTDLAGKRITSLDLRFEQFCDGSLAALRGRILIQAGTSI